MGAFADIHNPRLRDLVGTAEPVTPIEADEPDEVCHVCGASIPASQMAHHIARNAVSEDWMPVEFWDEFFDFEEVIDCE